MTEPTDGDPDHTATRGPAHEATRTGTTPGAPPASFGPYRLLQKIGEGGMGEVWLAEQTEPVRRRVALKLIKAGMDTKQVVARFEAERQALAMMDHPSIAKVYDAGATPEGRPYFVMEHIQGVPITEHCDRQRLTNRERLELFVQVCEGVQHAHQKAVIHRDLKPSNVLVIVLDGRAVPRIIDFGVAKATAQRLTETTLFTELGALVGTPEYMSPEQAELSGQDVDTRADVYSLGVMLYELLVGVLPFDSKALRSAGYAEIVRKIREEEPPKPSTRLGTLGEQSTESAKRRQVDLKTLRSELRGDLDWIAMKAIEKDRTRRYGSPAELAADVVRHMRNEPVLASPPSARYRAGKFVRRHRLGVSVAAVTVVALVGFAVAMALQARRIAAERDRADREREASDKVSEFLANMLGSVDPRVLGIALWKDLHERVAEVQQRRGATPEKVAMVLAALDETLSGVNGTDAARRLLDEQILARAGQTIERELAREPRIAGRLEHTLGDTYRVLGVYEPAERHARRAAEIRAGLLGTDHPETLASMTNLANAYYSQGRYDEAEKLHEETLEIRRRVLGPDHPDTLSSLYNVANVYSSQGRHDEAEKLDQEVLEVRRRVLGPDHPSTLRSMSNLASGYRERGRFDEAEKLYAETLEIQRRVLGPDDPDTLASMNNLAAAYGNQGRYAEAEKLHEEALAIRRRVVGEDHPDTLQSMNNLANAYGNQGLYAEAVKLHEEALEIRRRVLGPHHPATLRSMNNLASGYSEQGRYAEAAKLHEESLAIQRRVLGADHPDTLRCLHNLACVAALQGDRKRALDWLTQAVDHGYSDANQMAQDDDLKSLRGDAAFEALLARARENAAKSK